MTSLKFRDQHITLLQGEDLAAALRRHGLLLRSSCGGRKQCGKCSIKLISGTFLHNREIITGNAEDPPVFPACSLYAVGGYCEADFTESAFHPAELTPENLHLPDCGTPLEDTLLAIDLGTTNIAAALIRGGRVIKAAEYHNFQSRFGDNFIDRIAFASDEKNRQILRDALIEESILPLLEYLIPQEDAISRITVAGNTAMTHFFFGEDPEPLGRSPFTSGRSIFAADAARLGLDAVSRISGKTPVEGIAPLCALIGGDITAGLALAGFGRSGRCELYIDLGTNCEMVLSHADQYYAVSAAAGPAFELQSSGKGIDHIRRNASAWLPEPDSGSGNFRASALVDLMAELHRHGFVDRFGKLLKSPGLPGTGITESQLAELVTAKAAIESARNMLLDEPGITTADIEKVYLAGNFSRHIDLSNAVYTGLLPDLPEKCFERLGNASLAGAAAAALFPEIRANAETFPEKVRHINPAGSPEYIRYFTSAMNIRRGDFTDD